MSKPYEAFVIEAKTAAERQAQREEKKQEPPEPENPPTGKEEAGGCFDALDAFVELLIPKYGRAMVAAVVTRYAGGIAGSVSDLATRAKLTALYARSVEQAAEVGDDDNEK